MKFNGILSDLRKQRGWTQKELAKKTGVSESTIRMYELGERRPDFEKLEKLADLFHVDMNYMLGHTDVTVKPSGDETDPPEGINVRVTVQENDLIYAWRHSDDNTRRIVAYALGIVGRDK